MLLVVPMPETKFMQEPNDKIPLFKTWKHWYIAVIVFLVLQIILFKLLTNYFA
jgi:hypothetical protein